MIHKNEVYRIIAFGIGVLVLIISFIFDNRLVEFAKSIKTPPITYILSWTNYSIFLIILMLIMTSFFMWEGKKRDWIIPIWIAFLLTSLFIYLLKLLVARESPSECFMPILNWKIYSFPSASVGICISLSTILHKVYPALKWFWIIFTVIITSGKIYLGGNFISDIIAGILIGAALGITIISIKEKYNFFGANI
ncbi:MAG: phosphatase PAP2 family protein [Nanobdellota archaeon]